MVDKCHDAKVGVDDLEMAQDYLKETQDRRYKNNSKCTITKYIFQLEFTKAALS